VTAIILPVRPDRYEKEQPACQSAAGVCFQL